MRITICTIIKDETRYLEEWIKHNLDIGFTDIHLFEDYGSESHKLITDKYENVFLHSYDEVDKTDYNIRDKKQIDLFNHFVKHYKDKYDWCAFIDVDEFIRFENGYNFEKLCREFSKYNGIMLQQKTYGANGNVTRPKGGIQENYTVNPQCYHKHKFRMKTIVNFNKDSIVFKGVHRIRGAVFTNFSNKLETKDYYGKAWYDHYYTKSWEDWYERFTKRGDVVPGNVQIDEFLIYNNDLREKITIPYNIFASSLEIHAVHHCNVNCKGCSHFSPLSDASYFLTPSLFEEDLSKIPFNLLNSFKELHILGGEPLLNENIIDIIKIARKYYVYKPIKLITNALILNKVSENLMPILHECNVILSMSKYPIKDNEFYYQIENACMKNKVIFEYYSDMNNYDFIKYELVKEGNLDKDKNYSVCRNIHDWHCCQLVGTKLYPCPIMAYVWIFEKYFNEKFGDREFIDLSTSSLTETDGFLSHSYDFCKFCNMENGKSFKWCHSKKNIDEWT